MNDPNPMDGSEVEGRCGAETRDGTPCKKSPIPGGNRCRLHGGASPLAQQKAKERLLAAADPAAAVLVEIVKDEELKPRDRIRAAKEILDRAGVEAASAVELGTNTELDSLREALQDGFKEANEASAGGA